MRSLTLVERRTVSRALSVGSILVPLCVPSASQSSVPSDEKSASEPVLADAAVAPFRIELLDTAFHAASAMPLIPHLKNRSKAQEAVVAACFELDQPVRALRYSEEIANWRKGVGYAEFAHYCAEHGHIEKAERYLDLAYQIVESIQGDDAQDWHRDRIRARIARTYLVLGRSEEAALFGSGLVDSEVAAFEAHRAGRLAEEDFDQTIAALEANVVIGNFDHLRNSTETYLQLFDRFYDDPERHRTVEERLRSSAEKLPLSLQVEVCMSLGDIAVAHEDRASALHWANEGKRLFEGSLWPAEDEIPLRAKLAILRHTAGEQEPAYEEANAALEGFKRKRSDIVNIYRANALRPLAEAYHVMGRTADAKRVYAMTLEEGFENPNLWPRADDLAETCCSMALHGFEPDEELWELVRRLQAALVRPG